jgi:hypothetical protein
MKYFEQQAGLGSTSKAKTGNSTLALLFFAMGAFIASLRDDALAPESDSNSREGDYCC